MALRLEDGSLIWDRPIAAKLPEEESIRDHGFAASSVAATGEVVYEERLLRGGQFYASALLAGDRLYCLTAP